MKSSTRSIVGVGMVGMALLLTGCGEEPATASSAPAASGISPQKMSDALYAVMEADRAVYTKKVIERLVKNEKVIKASEHYEDDKALPLPAQMFRFGSEHVAKKTDAFSYSLISSWPINKQNEPKTPVEKEGVEYIVENPGKNFYKTETLGGQSYFTAVYPDVAVAAPCMDCHNDHKDSPKTDFQIGDIMGGVVIRIPL